MPYVENAEELKQVLNTINEIPVSESAKAAILRPTKHFEIVTGDNPDMLRTLALQEKFIEEELNKLTEKLSEAELELKRKEFAQIFQQNLSEKARCEQNELIKKLEAQGVPILNILEDKGLLASGGYNYFTDQIFATDTGQYFDKGGELTFIPANFKNKQRQGEERLAIAQAINIGATVSNLRNKDGSKLLFEGGDIRQMPERQLFFIGQGHRSDADTSKAIAEISGYYVLPIKLVQPQFYHLDCCFLPLPNDSAVIYEGEYLLDEKGQKCIDKNGWPMIKIGTETMTNESRALIRTLYPMQNLILISKQEALAFATNAAILQSATDGRFKMFVNGDHKNRTEDELSLLDTHQISYTQENINLILQKTNYRMDVIELPYSTMHGSGGSIRCSIQEMACTKSSLKPFKLNEYYFSDKVDNLEKQIYNSHQKRDSFFSPPNVQQEIPNQKQNVNKKHYSKKI